MASGSISRLIAGSEEPPQSSRRETPGALTRMHACERPPSAKAFPLPMKVTRSGMTGAYLEARVPASRTRKRAGGTHATCLPQCSTVVGQKTRTEKASTGVPGLDEVLDGGLPRDRLFLIDGIPGVGKTTLSMQFLLAGVAAGERAMYVTLAETKDELAAVAKSHGWKIDDIAVYELLSDIALGDADENTIFHPADIELAETMKTLLAEIERVDPDRVVIDSLSELRLQAQSALRYRRQILALKQHFAGRHMTVLMLDDRTTSREDVQLHSIAHGVITLDHLAPEYGGDRRRLRVNKIRGMKVRGGYHDFNIQTGGLVVYPRLVASEHVEPFKEGTVPSGGPRAGHPARRRARPRIERGTHGAAGVR